MSGTRLCGYIILPVSPIGVVHMTEDRVEGIQGRVVEHIEGVVEGQVGGGGQHPELGCQVGVEGWDGHSSWGRGLEVGPE